MTEFSDDAFAEITELLRADTRAALASIAQSRALAARLGLDLSSSSSPDTTGGGKRGPSVSGSKGKSKPNLAGWLRRAAPDGTLPIPNNILIVSARMVAQGLQGGYIVGEQHPYQATASGLVYAMAAFKGRKIARG